MILREAAESRRLATSIHEHFADLTDPRRREPTWPLIDMIVMALCAVICGADDFVAIARWAKTKRNFLSRFINVSKGTPSHDRFNAVFGALRPGEFEKCLLSWITALHQISDGQLIAIDGKTLRDTLRSHEQAIHLLSLLDQKTGCVLSQTRVDAKTNEAKAALALLKNLVPKGRVITGDAIFCQREVCQQIIDE